LRKRIDWATAFRNGSIVQSGIIAGALQDLRNVAVHQTAMRKVLDAAFFLSAVLGL
jgi:hypothetical protein